MLIRRPMLQSEEGSIGLPDLGDSIDAVTFEQILEMDDDEDDREFSKSIVFGFFEQAEQTFVKMDDALLVPIFLFYFCSLWKPKNCNGATTTGRLAWLGSKPVKKSLAMGLSFDYSYMIQGIDRILG